MDPLATYEVITEAVERAKEPDGTPTDEDVGRATRPTLVEAVQYRFGAHTTADDPTAYRDDEEVERWKRWDPIPRMETYLRERGTLDDERIDAIETEITETVAEAIERGTDFEADPENLFADAYAELPERVKDQREYLRRLREEYGDEALLEDH
jgi:pyruvate dehydrogenase E1 component alpha subunit